MNSFGCPIKSPSAVNEMGTHETGSEYVRSMTPP